MSNIELLKNAVPPLLGWYRNHKRDLPWRENRDPYRVWISEIMLQQTRVEAVKQYYLRFLKQFPTVRALADADISEVLKAWEGLGYYSRARNLHAAARIVAEQGFPETPEGVRALPGVGDYTAGAICSIAYDLPCPAVDGNVLRVLTRLFADESNIDDGRTKAAFAAALKEAYPPQAGDFCQALMELGAIVCVPNAAPLCEKCPWEKLCRAHLAGETEKYPVRAEKRARKVEELAVFVLEEEGRFALEQRGKSGLLAGLWQFPLAEAGALRPEAFGDTVATKRAKHIFTHIEWRMTGYLIRAREFFPAYVWADAEEIAASFALPSAFKAFFSWLGNS